jgi:hypothetical protein
VDRRRASTPLLHTVCGLSYRPSQLCRNPPWQSLPHQRLFTAGDTVVRMWELGRPPSAGAVPVCQQKSCQCVRSFPDSGPPSNIEGHIRQVCVCVSICLSRLIHLYTGVPACLWINGGAAASLHAGSVCLCLIFRLTVFLSLEHILALLINSTEAGNLFRWHFLRQCTLCLCVCVCVPATLCLCIC